MVAQSTYNLNINGQSTLSPALKAWEIFLKDQSKSPHTIKSFIGDLQLLETYIPMDKMISDITTSDLNDFLVWVKTGRGKDIPCSPKSYSRRVTSIKSFFRWLQKNARIPMDPAKSILQHTVISPLPEVLSHQEQVLVLESAQKMQKAEKADLRPYLLLKLLLESGIKKSECINIKMNHITSEVKEPFIFIRYPNVKDRNKERKVNVSQEWINVLKAFLIQKPGDDSLFPWSPRRLEYMLEDIGKAANLTKHLSFSMCRWTSALNDLNAGVETDVIRQKMGVSKIQWRELKIKLEQLIRKLG
jgi:site-specific recombinase XerD